MRHEIRKRKNFKFLFRVLLPLLAGPPAAALLLAMLCLGREALAPPPTPAVKLDLTIPLLAWDGPSEEAPPSESWDQSVSLTVSIDGKTVETTLGDYLWGVVAAEMPASFDQQALNAQACAARTYTVYKLLHPTSAHDTDLCDNTGCCQAWMSREERMAAWGSEGALLEKKITQAVAETDGMGVCYDRQVIQAVFHAASGESTRSARAVWGHEVAYLQSVPSPEGEEVPNYYSAVTLTSEAFAAQLPECDLSGSPTGWIGEILYDESGLSRALVIGGKEISTATLRSRFSLRSACLEAVADEDGVTFYVTGYGHGVGMSQYGANALAKQGKSWQEILRWYYSGTSVENLADKCPELG